MRRPMPPIEEVIEDDLTDERVSRIQRKARCVTVTTRRAEYPLAWLLRKDAAKLRLLYSAHRQGWIIADLRVSGIVRARYLD